MYGSQKTFDASQVCTLEQPHCTLRIKLEIKINECWPVACPIYIVTGRTSLAVRPDVLNAKYHVKTNATYSCREVNKNNFLGGQFLILLPKNPGK